MLNQEQVAPSDPTAQRLDIDPALIRRLVLIMQHMGKRQDAQDLQIEELNTRMNNLHGAFQELIGQLEKKVDMIEAAALEKAKAQRAA